MAEYNTQAPTMTPRPQHYLEDILICIAMIMAPMAAFTLTMLLITLCAELVRKWIRPYFRHRRTDPLLTGTHELDEFNALNSNNYHTIQKH